MTETTTFLPETETLHATEAALTSARKKSSDVRYSDEFLVFLTDRHKNVANLSQPEYWEDFALFTSRASHEASSAVEKDAEMIVGFLPNFLLKQHGLNTKSFENDMASIRGAKRTACTYIGLLREFVTNHPLSYDEFETQLLSAAQELLGSETEIDPNDFESVLDNSLRGIRHEKGFLQILDQLGVEYRLGTTNEDLKGRDVVIIFRGHEIGVDVKSSLDKVDGNNDGHGGSPVAIKSNGDIVMFSLLKASDFDGGFTVSSERLQDIAPVAGAFLQGAILQSIAKKS